MNEWLKQRKEGIGGSDAAAILGINPWKSPYQVWQEKTSDVENTESPAMEWGKLLEPVIRQKYADQTGNNVLYTGCKIFKTKKNPFMLGTVDGLIIDQAGSPEGVLEIKTARVAAGWGDEGSNDIPNVYFFQVQHYLEVCGLKWADVAVLIGGSDFRIYRIEKNQELTEKMIEAEKRFWFENVLKNIAPDPVCVSDAQQIFKKPAAGSEIISTLEIEKSYEQLKLLTEQSKQIEQKIEAEKMVLMSYVGNNEILQNRSGSVLLTWKKSKDGVKFDSKKFESENPDIFKKYLIDTQGLRRFLIK